MPKDPLTCPKCNKEFTIKSNLRRHIRCVHNIAVERQDIHPAHFDVYHYKCLEEGCNVSFRYNRDLRTHLSTTHNFDVGEMNLAFPSPEEFTRWLNIEEKNNCVQFYHSTAMKKKINGWQTVYYECNRSGKQHVLDDSIRKRRMRKNGPKKLNRGCTSQIILNKFGDTYNVVYYKSHYGHSMDVKHVRISKLDRSVIVSKLLLGVPVQSVLSSTMSHLKRISHKDVVNIKNSISSSNSGSAGIKTNLTDFISECSQHHFNPILYFGINTDHVGEDGGEICLAIMNQLQAQTLQEFGNNNIIMISSTLISHSDLELITIHIPFSSGQWYPAACMFSNGVNFKTVLELFFTKIKEVVGTVTPSVFISKVDKTYYDAWKNVMGDVQQVLYGSDQVEYDWKVNLNKVTSEDLNNMKLKRVWALNTFKFLKNIDNAAEFAQNLDETIKILEADQDFKEFLKYYFDNFDNPKKWASCYRDKSFDMPSEELDKIKSYIDGLKRFDGVFHSLIRYIRDETLNNDVVLGNRASILSENFNCHKRMPSIKMKAECVSNDTWNVSTSEKSVAYVVQRLREERCCDLVCSTCGICVHTFGCTCANYFLTNAICVHIHYVCTYFQCVVEAPVDIEEEMTDNVDEALSEEERREDLGEVVSEEEARKEVCEVVSEETGDVEVSDETNYFGEEIVIEVEHVEDSSHNICNVQNQIRFKALEIYNNISNVSDLDSLITILKDVSKVSDLTTPGEEVIEEEGTEYVLLDHTYV